MFSDLWDKDWECLSFKDFIQFTTIFLSDEFVFTCERWKHVIPIVDVDIKVSRGQCYFNNFLIFLLIYNELLYMYVLVYAHMWWVNCSEFNIFCLSFSGLIRVWNFWFFGKCKEYLIHMLTYGLNFVLL